MSRRFEETRGAIEARERQASDGDFLSGRPSYPLKGGSEARPRPRLLCLGAVATMILSALLVGFSAPAVAQVTSVGVVTTDIHLAANLYGSLGAEASEAWVVSDTGYVAGVYWPSGVDGGYANSENLGVAKAFRWTVATDASTVVPIDLGGSWAHPLEVNTAGQVAGTGASATGETTGFLFKNGVTTPLTSGCGPLSCPSEALALNDQGEVAGASFGASGSIVGATVWWSAGTTKNDFSFPPPTPDFWEVWGSTVFDINNNRQVVGTVLYQGSEGVTLIRGFFWEPGMSAAALVEPLPGGFQTNLGCSSYVVGLFNHGCLGGYPFVDPLNERGEAAGVGYPHAIRWRPNPAMPGTYCTEDLGDLDGGSGYSQAFAINERGEITGFSSKFGEEHAFRWRPPPTYDPSSTPCAPPGTPAVGTMDDLGTIGGTFSWGTAINNQGLVACDSTDPSDAYYAALCTSTGQVNLGALTSFDVSGFNVFSWTFDINDQNQVFGGSNEPGGRIHAAMWEVGDGDNDGINDLIDSDPGTFPSTYSNTFDDLPGVNPYGGSSPLDGGGTFGRIVDRKGNTVYIVPRSFDDYCNSVLPRPEPVSPSDNPCMRIGVTGGYGNAEFEACSPVYRKSATPGSTWTLRCGSLELSVETGEVTMTLPGGPDVVVPAGARVLIEELEGGGFRVTNDRSSLAVVTVGGAPLQPGESVIVLVNESPSVTITGPSAGSVFATGTMVTFTGAFVDPDSEDTHTAEWTFDSLTIPGTVTESGGSGTVSDSYAFTAAGVYRVSLTVTDGGGVSGRADTVDGLEAFVVIYDPTAGFVTGGGWFDSPPGAFAGDPSAAGKATFGFVSKYQKGKTLPTGETEFQFKAGDLTFRSTSYDWLVCSGPKCMFRGTGTVNGAGTYGFQLTAWDGDIPGGGGQDKIRMKIWDLLTGQLVYDNQIGDDDFADPTTVIGGGSIVIRKG